ncbi:hypothetical protein H0H93_003670 [Arthromyces matolae]|nr:hypothetical protein H0H93_003670 [Arthromyces matolae]
MPQTVAFPITARLLWRLVFDYDNSGNEGTIRLSLTLTRLISRSFSSLGSIEHKYTYTESGSYVSTEFNESVASHAKKLHDEQKIEIQVGASYGPVSANIGAGHTSSKEIDDMLQNTTRTQTESTVSYSRTEERTYTVGPNSRLCLYQRNFKGPGLGVAETTFRTTPLPLTNEELEEEVPVDLVLAPKSFIKGIKVVYTDRETQAPSTRIRDMNGGSDDINHGQAGKYVWLVAETTTIAADAVTHIDLVITGSEDKRYDDLAKGAKGKYRYLIPTRQYGDSVFMTGLRLYRSQSEIFHGGIDLYSRFTDDINAGRGGDYLYLIWKKERAYPVA